MIRDYPKEIHTDNVKEFVNKFLEKFLKSIEVEHILRSLYYPQSQSTVEAFNKNVKRKQSRVFANSQKSNE